MMQVTRIVIVQNDLSCDMCHLHLSIPEGTYPFTENAIATMRVAIGNGPAYCSTHFPDVPQKILDYRTK